MSATPFDFWTGMWRSSQALADCGLKLAETMQAAGAVIDSRSRTILDATRDPLRGDYAELGRMVPEKVTAFSKAGAAAMGEVGAIQAQALANWRVMLRIAGQGRLATPAEIGAMTTRSAAMVERSAKAPGKALAPIHRGARGNARRLARDKKR